MDREIKKQKSKNERADGFEDLKGAVCLSSVSGALRMSADLLFPCLN
jgi:hypothetical protein